MAIEYRLGVEQDDVPTYYVFAEANRELSNRRGLPDTFGPDPPVRMMAFRGYARQYHGDGYWVAYDGARMVGFGIGVRHPGVWYLAALQILPEYQGKGIGQRLLELTLRTAEESDAVCAISAGMQPVSNAIYVRAGMLPWVPIFDWETAEGAEVPELEVDTSVDFRPTRDVSDIADIDRRVVGIDRGSQLEFWLEQPDMECYVLSRKGEPGGYAFVSNSGAIGPAAVLEQSDGGMMLAAAVDRLRANGVEHVSFQVAGLCPEAYGVITRLGLRIAGTALIMVTSRPLWTPGHYFPSPTDALY